MSNFLTNIHINKIFHLNDIEIQIDEYEKKHLIITGRNGSGKTSLLNNLADLLQHIYLYKGEKLIQYMSVYEEPDKQVRVRLNYSQNSIWDKSKNIKISFNNINDILNKVKNNDILFAYFSSRRKTEVIVPKSPEKPNLEPTSDIKSSKQSEFLKFLVDLKIQEALARNENETDGAGKIKIWFNSFEELLCEIFEGSKVTLNFNYKDYSFIINQDGREFGFNQLADGYSAIIDIIADLILKMQTPDNLTRFYEKEGIVLIDEIETHLHLELQRLILPMLTRVFPNIQFIVTTHSPFVLSSIENAVAFDLEKRERLEDLTEYSYEALAEGYFKVKTESNFLQAKLNRYKELAEKSNRDSAENAEFESLDNEFQTLDETLAPQHVIGSYRQIKLISK